MLPALLVTCIVFALNLGEDIGKGQPGSEEDLAADTKYVITLTNEYHFGQQGVMAWPLPSGMMKYYLVNGDQVKGPGTYLCERDQYGNTTLRKVAPTTMPTTTPVEQ